MTYSVYQHWDPLRVCIVGRSYPPEFYSWIKVPRVRNLFEKIARETEEDYQNLVQKLQEFGVQVFRPELGDLSQFLMPDDKRYQPPPMYPRDVCIMIGDRFYQHFTPSQPGYQNPYDNVLDRIRQQGNEIKYVDDPGAINGSTVSRLGRDLYFGTERYNQDTKHLEHFVKNEFTGYRTHVVNTGGHIDGTYCPVTPGLIFSIVDAPSFAETFPGWEVVYLENQSWGKIRDWGVLKNKNNGKWWIPGFEQDQDVIHTVEKWLSHWVGYVEETVFDVNMLMLDTRNILMLGYNQQVIDALSRYDITAHIVPFRHRYFWDGGLHCITADLDREGQMQDYFIERSNG
jgi:N-dimethylarginine dimethylaminohydrolase